MAFLILVIAPVDCFTCRTSAQDLELGVLADLLELLWGDVAVPPRQDGARYSPTKSVDVAVRHAEPSHLVAEPLSLWKGIMTETEVLRSNQKYTNRFGETEKHWTLL